MFLEIALGECPLASAEIERMREKGGAWRNSPACTVTSLVDKQ